MYTHPAPTEDELNRRYENAYRLHHHDELPADYIPHKDARAQAQKNFILQHSSVATFDRITMLEIGCGIGALLRAVAELPNAGELTGIEPSPDMRDRARPRLPEGTRLLGGTFSTNTFDDGAFDLVAGSHILEHVPDPTAHLADIRSKVRPGGVLFLEVPHETELGVREITVARQKNLMHLLFFDRETLLAALRTAGWHVLHASDFGPSRASFSSVPARRRPWPLRVRRRGAKLLEQLSDLRRDSRASSATAGTVEAFATENTHGIWLRVVAVNSPGHG